MRVYLGIFFVSLAFFMFLFWTAYILVPYEDIIWKNKGRIFRVRKKGRYWIVEKKFLCFFVKNELFGTNQFISTKEDAIKKLSEYIQELDETQKSESIIDYTKFISDPTKLIEAKKLETKRIKYEQE